MESLPGAPLAGRGQIPEPETAAVASLLASLHATPVRGLPVRDATSVVRSLRRKVAGIEVERERFRRVVEALVEGLPAPPAMVTGHGDFSPRNVMKGPSGLALIDFDRLQLSSPTRDVTYWGAWIWVTSLMTGGSGDWTQGDRLLVEYAATTGRLATDAEVAFHRIAALVRIVHGWSALADRPEIVALIAEEAERQSEYVR
jgi:aminoglycoside phosphotransferase (APT) family kinase protein